GRVGLWRSRRASRSDRQAPAKLPSPDLAQPAAWHRRLCAADTRSAGGTSLRRRLSAGSHAEQPGGPGDTLEHPCIATTVNAEPAETAETFGFENSASSAGSLFNVISVDRDAMRS